MTTLANIGSILTVVLGFVSEIITWIMQPSQLILQLGIAVGLLGVLTAFVFKLVKKGR